MYIYNKQMTPTKGDSSMDGVDASAAQLKHSDESGSYYTVVGKVALTATLVKIFDGGRQVKEGHLFHESGYIPLNLWNDIWQKIPDGARVNITNLR